MLKTETNIRIRASAMSGGIGSARYAVWMENPACILNPMWNRLEKDFLELNGDSGNSQSEWMEKNGEAVITAGETARENKAGKSIRPAHKPDASVSAD